MWFVRVNKFPWFVDFDFVACTFAIIRLSNRYKFHDCRAIIYPAYVHAINLTIVVDLRLYFVFLFFLHPTFLRRNYASEIYERYVKFAKVSAQYTANVVLYIDRAIYLSLFSRVRPNNLRASFTAQYSREYRGAILAPRSDISEGIANAARVRISRHFGITSPAYNVDKFRDRSQVLSQFCFYSCFSFVFVHVNGDFFFHITLLEDFFTHDQIAHLRSRFSSKARRAAYRGDSRVFFEICSIAIDFRRIS